MDYEAKVIERALLAESSRNQTAKKAAQILLKSESGYVLPNAKQKRLLLIEFAKKNLVVYGKAFDLVRLAANVDLEDSKDIGRNLDKIVLCEIKSSKRALAHDFKGYFFALTTAELLVAQNLKSHYRFIFVNTVTENFLELTLQEIFGRARGIYPTWSIMF